MTHQTYGLVRTFKVLEPERADPSSDFPRFRCSNPQTTATLSTTTMSILHLFRSLTHQSATFFLALISLPMIHCATPSYQTPITLGPGPHLFIDEHLIADQSFLSRTVNQPAKLAEPVITGRAGGDDNFQPYLSVLRDPDTARFRIWYGTPENSDQSHIATMESLDGINWIRPHRVLTDPHLIRFGVSVIDRGPGFLPGNERYILAFYENDGMKIALSADGLEWHMLTTDSVWKHNHDINSLHWDPIRRQFLAIGSVLVRLPGEESRRRIPHQTISTDLLHWEPIWPIINPKIGAPIEKGETQFYSMSGVIARGDLLIGLVKILRDDLNATPGKTAEEMGEMERKAAGLGYTVLAWTRDGVHWQRDHQPFIPNDPVPGRWDHAMAWGDEQIVVGDETYIYYGGYARGHKVARFDERQIGLAIMPRDRYVAREADLNQGRLMTRALLLNGSNLTVNARVVGALRVRLLDQDGESLPEFDWIELRGDSTEIPVDWAKSIASLSGKAVRLEFELTNACLFGFDLR